MKVIIFTFVLATIGDINSFQVKKIEGVDGDVLDVLFDSQNNVYISSSGPEEQGPHRIYKLDSQYNIVFSMEVRRDFGCSILLNNKDEMCAMCGSEDPDYFADINILRADSSELEKITSIDISVLKFFGDNDGNLMFGNIDPGLVFLKYNTTEPVRVRNLRKLVDLENIVPDSEGNTFLNVQDIISGEERLVVIPADSKEGTPEAYVIEGVFNSSARDSFDEMKAIPNGILVSVSNSESGSLKKISNNTVTNIYSDEGYRHYTTHPGKTRTLIVAYGYFQPNSRITSLSPDGELVEISDPRNGSWNYGRYKISVDDEGDAFIEWQSLQEERSRLNFLNRTSTSTVDVDVKNIKFISYTLFDGNNNLWINTEEAVYFLRKGSLEVEMVPDSSDFRDIWVNSKKKSSEVFISTGTEFYVISD